MQMCSWTSLSGLILPPGRGWSIWRGSWGGTLGSITICFFGPHLVYTLADLLGPIAHLSAVPARGPSRLGGEDSLVAIMALASGAVAGLRISYAYRAPRSGLPWPEGWQQGLEINGSEGSLRVSVSPVGRVELFRHADADWATVADGLAFADSFSGAIAAFLAARQPGGLPDLSAADAVRLLALMRTAMAASV